MVICKTMNTEYTWNDNQTLFDMRRRRRENVFQSLKKVPKTQVFS